MKNLSIDLETYSSVNLQKSGVYKYAESPDFKILLFGYSVDGGAVQVVDLAMGEEIPQDIINALTDDSVIKWAFNAQFERICLSRYLLDKGISLNPFHDKHPLSLDCSRYLDPSSWHCSLVWSATLGLPLSLEGVGAVLGLEKQKMSEGKNLIRCFCIPNKNGGRNMPSDDMEKWRIFKTYNLRDVETEMAIQKKLSRFPVPESIWDEYHLDQEINDNGIGVDKQFITNAIKFDARSKEVLTEKMQELTNLENPNSVQQMKNWLADNGIEAESLGKKVLADLIQNTPNHIASILTLRGKLAKSSVKKYTAMENALCLDNRVRGMFQFYGANRTGRFAGRLVQLQNLPQNHIPDLAQARELVKSGNYDALEMLYEDIPDTLSQLIRTAFVPQDDYRFQNIRFQNNNQNNKFIVADFSAIEARVIAWLAGEKWRMRAFADGEDIYCASASKMFGVPVVKHGINGHLRQKGKVAELACIAEGQLVTTNHGLMPIEYVTENEWVWDGENWVQHDGVICKGFPKLLKRLVYL